MLIETHVLVRGDHPALADHFPGRPIVPGAVLLDAALAAGVGAGLPAPGEIVVVKFTASLGPDTPVLVRFDSRADGKIRLTCRGQADGTVHLDAVIECPAPRPGERPTSEG